MTRRSVVQREALRRSRDRRRERDRQEEARAIHAAVGPPTADARLAALETALSPRRRAALACGWCNGRIEPKTRGRIPKWCSAGCRQRAWEQTRAARSGLAAVKVVERAVPAAAIAAKPRTPHHGDWAPLLLELALNRESYDEYLEVVMKAWAKDSFNHSGPHYQAPFPATGIANWPAAPWTRRFGGPDEVDEVDEQGTIHEIGVIPKPVRTPQVFIPTPSSRQTVIDAAHRGHTLLMLVGDRERIVEVAKLYRAEAKEAGRILAPGENIGVVAKIAVGDTFDEAFDLAARTSGYFYQNFFSNFGITQMYRNASDGPNMYRAADERALTQRMIERGDLLCGTTEQVHEGLSELHTLYGQGTLDWFVWESFTQTLPEDHFGEVARSQLKIVAEDILPKLG